MAAAARKLAPLVCALSVGFLLGRLHLASLGERVRAWTGHVSEPTEASDLSFQDDPIAFGASGLDSARSRAAKRKASAAALQSSWLAELSASDLPLPLGTQTEAYLRQYTDSPEGRQRFIALLMQASRLAPVVRRSLHDAGLPLGLEAVVFVESGFSPTAVSSAGAAGLWQLMPETARRYDLLVGADCDERRSVEKSSRAAVRYLAELYGRFGSWELALCAYNMGEEALRQKLPQFGQATGAVSFAQVEPLLPRETAQYVPKVAAVATLLSNLGRFGFSLPSAPSPMPTAELDVPAGTELSLVARACGTSVRQLRELNPELLSLAISKENGPYAVHIPSSGMARAQIMLPALMSMPRQSRLDLLVAEDFDWGRDELPSDGTAALEASQAGERTAQEMLRGVKGQSAALASGAGSSVVFFRLGEKDSLSSVAQLFGVEEKQLRRENSLAAGQTPTSGQLLHLTLSSQRLSALLSPLAPDSEQAAIANDSLPASRSQSVRTGLTVSLVQPAARPAEPKQSVRGEPAGGVAQAVDPAAQATTLWWPLRTSRQSASWIWVR